MPVDGREANLSDDPELLPEEKPSPYVYIKNPNVSLPKPIENHHWLSSGFGFHFKGRKGDEDDVSTIISSFCTHLDLLYSIEYGKTTSETSFYHVP